MCNNRFSVVQFPGILETDTQVTLNTATYPSPNTVQDLVDNNPQFWWDFGNSGIHTLCTYIKVDTLDITFNAQRGATPISVKGIPFIGGRPSDR